MNKKSSKKKAKDAGISALRFRVALRAVRWGGAASGAVSLPIAAPGNMCSVPENREQRANLNRSLLSTPIDLVIDVDRIGVEELYLNREGELNGAFSVPEIRRRFLMRTRSASLKQLISMKVKLLKV